MDTDNMNSDEIYYQAIESKRNDKIEEAVRLFKIASEKGNENAMNKLGEIYGAGYKDVPININESMTYYQMSADAGNIKGLICYCNSIVSGKTQFDPNIQ